MQVQKRDIRQTILCAARENFLEHGFKDSSMRRIAKMADVGLSNIYNYFKNKDEIFCEVLRPLLNAFDKLIEEHNSEHYITTDIFTMKPVQQRMMNDMLIILKEYRDELRLLLFESAGSSLENFRDTYSDAQTEMGKEYLRLMKQKYPHLNGEISPFFIHITSSMWLTVIGEIVLHDQLTKEEVEVFLSEYITYGTAGWRAVLNA